MGVQALTNTHNYETNSIYLSYTGDNMCYRYAIRGYYYLQSYENILYYNNEYHFIGCVSFVILAFRELRTN